MYPTGKVFLPFRGNTWRMMLGTSCGTQPRIAAAVELHRNRVSRTPRPKVRNTKAISPPSCECGELHVQAGHATMQWTQQLQPPRRTIAWKDLLAVNSEKCYIPTPKSVPSRSLDWSMLLQGCAIKQSVNAAAPRSLGVIH